MNHEQFPILRSGIYANHAAICPWPKVTSEAVAAFAAENSRDGPRNYRDWIARERDLRATIETLINAPSAQDIALLKNTTEGICAVAFGFPWTAGDNVVIPKGEFASNRLPWLEQQSRGVEVREVDIRGIDRPEADLMNAMDERTRLLAVSAVQYSDGLRLDLDKLGSECRSNGIFFFVDAIQQLGALPLDVQACQADAVAADAHKWLLGPEGIAAFYCREPLRSMLSLTQVGWHMFDNPWVFDRDDWSPSPGARRFEAGTPNSMGQAGMHASLELLLGIGMVQVSAAVLRNTSMLTQGLLGLQGVRVVSSPEPMRQSGIVSFKVKDGNIRAVYGHMTRAGVNSSLRNGSIRLSPHFYQDEAVMNQLLTIVADALESTRA